jgi:hypothetical protein
MKCCGEKMKGGATDAYGHFFVEPLSEGEYIAQFTSKGVAYTVNFAVMSSYDKCGPAIVELNFSAPDQCSVQEDIAVDYDEKDCPEKDPACYQK